MFKATVVGAGPAGIFAVAELLATQVYPIAWVDPNFNGGALYNYQSIPSNTKAISFLNCCYESSFFASFKEEIRKPFKNQEMEDTCSLTLAHEMLTIMTSILLKQKQVVSFPDVVLRYEQIKPAEWLIKLQQGKNFTSNVVILCTGSQNRCFQQEFPDVMKLNPTIKEIPLFSAMSQEKVKEVCTNDDIITIIGDRHSAILALMNLSQLHQSPNKIYLLYRNKLRFAEYLPDGRVKYDQSGLRGTVADWAKNTLLGNPPQNIELLYSNEDTVKEAIKNSTKFISAFGFTRSPIGQIAIAEGDLFQNDINYDPYNAQLKNLGQEQQRISGMYGFGIAFPEARIDLCGEKINAVGFHDFFEYINKVVREQVVPYLQSS